MQATHDILVYGMPASSAKMRLSATYDHFTFPGAVPRTFLGSVVLAGLSQPVIALVGFAHAQLVVRAMLGIFNSCSLLAFRFAVDKTLGKATGRWWVLLMACQFHLPFYMTRTLPNMFSFGLSTFAHASNSYKAARLTDSQPRLLQHRSYIPQRLVAIKKLESSSSSYLLPCFARKRRFCWQPLASICLSVAASISGHSSKQESSAPSPVWQHLSRLIHTFGRNFLYGRNSPRFTSMPSSARPPNGASPHGTTTSRPVCPGCY